MKKYKRLFFALVIISGLLASTANATPTEDITNAKQAFSINDTARARELLLPLAESGNAEAQYLMSYTTTDPEKRQQWQQKAADNGYVKAQFFLALDKTREDKTPVPKEIVDKMRVLAENSDKDALYGLLMLAMTYEVQEIKSDFDFEQYLHKAAVQDVTYAQSKLSERYGRNDNAIMALFWKHKEAISTAAVAKKGYLYEQLRLGDWYRDGESVYFSDGQSHNVESIEPSPALAIYWYEQAAEKSAQGSVRLGELYSDYLIRYQNAQSDKGEKLAKQWADKAVFWFEKAVAQGDSNNAAKSLVALYSDEKYHGKDLAKAKKYQAIYMASQIKIAETGDIYYKANDPNQQYSIGKDFADAPEGVRDYEQAEVWLKKAVEQDYVEALTKLGKVYLREDNPKHNFATAKKWLETAAEQGDSEAMYELGEAYLWGKVVVQDFALAKQWYEKILADEQSRMHYSAQHRLDNLPLYKKYQRADQALMRGIVASIGNNSHEASKYLAPLAEAGNAEAQYYLSHSKGGWGGPNRQWLEKSAKGGFAKAQLEWASVVFNDTALSNDERNAQMLSWVEKAAAQDEPEAVRTMATFYNKGKFVTRDDKKALALYEKYLTFEDIDDYYKRDIESIITRLKK